MGGSAIPSAADEEAGRRKPSIYFGRFHFHRDRPGVPVVLVLVNSTMTTMELREVSAKLERQSQAAQKQFAADAERTGQAAMREQQESDEASRQRRLDGVTVAGVSAGGSMPTVLVRLGTTDIYEANATICRQSELWLKTDLSGTTLRVQSHRGNRPAVDVGQVSCR